MKTIFEMNLEEALTLSQSRSLTGHCGLDDAIKVALTRTLKAEKEFNDVTAKRFI